MVDRVSRRGKRKTVHFRVMFVWIIVFYFYNIFLPTYMHFITNVYKRFSMTNSTDPRQRVPLTLWCTRWSLETTKNRLKYTTLIRLFRTLLSFHLMWCSIWGAITNFEKNMEERFFFFNNRVNLCTKGLIHVTLCEHKMLIWLKKSCIVTTLFTTETYLISTQVLNLLEELLSAQHR